MHKFTINEETKGMRIDKYLVEKLDISRAVIQKLIKEEKINVNGNQVKANHKLALLDEVNVLEIKQEQKAIEAEKMDLDIVYEDEDVIVVNKPSNMVVHPAVGNFSGTLVNGLIYHTKNLSTVSGDDVRPGIVHRIDKDTSGLLMVAKNNNAHEKLAEQLRDKTTTRKYIALVHGNIIEDEGEIHAPIGRDVYDRKKMAITVKNSKSAETHFRVIERFEHYTLIECSLKTGRTHQIRVHMKYIGYPIVGDPMYGPRKTIDTKGQALHAKTLGFIHPSTGEYMEFDSELPQEFQETLAKVRE